VKRTTHSCQITRQVVRVGPSAGNCTAFQAKVSFFPIFPIGDRVLLALIATQRQSVLEQTSPLGAREESSLAPSRFGPPLEVAPCIDSVDLRDDRSRLECAHQGFRCVHDHDPTVRRGKKTDSGVVPRRNRRNLSPRLPNPHVPVAQNADGIIDDPKELLIGFAVLRPLLQFFLCASPIAADAFQREEGVLLIDFPHERLYVTFVD